VVVVAAAGKVAGEVAVEVGVAAEEKKWRRG
jgi:hypothetical protein